MSAQDFFTGTCPHCFKTISVATDKQKVAMQLLCMDLSRQLLWPLVGGQRLKARKWAQLLVAAWEREHEREANFVPAIDGEGWDVIWQRHDRLSKEELSEVLAFGNAFAAQNGVVRGEKLE